MKTTLIKYILLQAMNREPGYNNKFRKTYCEIWDATRNQMGTEGFLKHMISLLRSLHSQCTKQGLQYDAKHLRTATKATIRALTTYRNLDLCQFD